MIEFYRDEAQEHRWHIISDDNGEIIAASSEGFSSRKVAEDNLRLTHQHSNLDDPETASKVVYKG